MKLSWILFLFAAYAKKTSSMPMPDTVSQVFVSVGGNGTLVLNAIDASDGDIIEWYNYSLPGDRLSANTGLEDINENDIG